MLIFLRYFGIWLVALLVSLPVLSFVFAISSLFINDRPNRYFGDFGHFAGSALTLMMVYFVIILIVLAPTAVFGAVAISVHDSDQRSVRLSIQAAFLSISSFITASLLKILFASIIGAEQGVFIPLSIALFVQMFVFLVGLLILRSRPRAPVQASN